MKLGPGFDYRQLHVYLRTVEELNGLPDQAVVYDHTNLVWQKHYSHPFDAMSCVGPSWYLPGSEFPYAVDDVAVPARLLDDGL